MFRESKLLKISVKYPYFRSSIVCKVKTTFKRSTNIKKNFSEIDNRSEVEAYLSKRAVNPATTGEATLVPDSGRQPAAAFTATHVF